MHSRPARFPRTVRAPFALLPLLLVLGPPPQDPEQPDRAEIDRAVAEEFGVLRYELQRLALPDLAPGRFELAVRAAGRVRILELERHSVRDPLFRVQAWSAAGGYEEVPAPPVSTYRGRVRGEPGLLVVASLLPRGFDATVFGPEGTAWSVRPLAAALPGAPRPLHVAFRGAPAPMPADACGAGATGPGQAPAVASIPDAVRRSPRRVFPGPCLKRAQLAFDADFEYYQDQGASVDGTVAQIEGHMNVVDFFYARDVQITHTITEIVVRTAPFYAPTGGGSLLDLFRAQWNGPLSGVPRDMAHLMTGKPGSLIEYGGLAYVGVVCNLQWAYGWSMDGANIVGHELGHNWGAGHCHDPAPCNNMCGACFNVGPVTGDIILAFRDSRTCLEDAPAYPQALPPYAYPDSRTVSKKDYFSITPLAIDVLANDRDGNCDPLRLHAFDAVTERGATVALSYGTGAGGRNELLYTPPAEPFIGLDHFGYTVRGRNGPNTVGEVTVDVRPLELSGYWKLDDGAGSTSADAAPLARDGANQGAPVWTSGPYGGALAFDGSDDAVEIPALGLNGNHVTITAWVKRNGQQGAFRGLIFSRDGGTAAGLHFGSGNGLRYTWNDDPATYNWVPGLLLPDGQWAFVALVIEPDRATMYLHDGTLHSSVNTLAHDAEEFDGLTYLGWDTENNVRRFIGDMDDVRIYGHAMTSAEISDLVAFGGRADAPRPADGGKLPDPALGLNWVAGLNATSHDVYFGTGYVAVRDATPAAAEFQGNQAGTSFTPPPLVLGTRYWWRVDERIGGTVIEGDVWQFEPAIFHHWKLDETTGTIALDSAGNRNGTYQNGILIGQPAASPALVNSVRLDGVNDRVRVNPLDLDTGEITIAAWVRRDGGLNAWSGIVFTRAGGSVAGLNAGENNELRYHWNGAGNTWGWDSGLVLPDNQWVFACLVVGAEEAVMYLGDGGVLSSASHKAEHPVEAWDGAVMIGHDASSTLRYFRGWIDDVRIYDTAILPQDVRSLYDATRP